ncbi:MAG: histidine phosphatase family protein [Sphingobium sp.]
MKTLTLLRHAKSGWDDPVARDFDRPLNAKGMRAAIAMGRKASEEGLEVDRLIASPAARVKQTLDSFFEGLGRVIEPVWDRRIYLASSSTLLDIIRETSADVENLMLVGHNPGLEDLILDLVADDGGSPLRDIVESKYPTASLARMSWNGNNWAGLTASSGLTLDMLVRPRDLDPELGPDR